MMGLYESILMVIIILFLFCLFWSLTTTCIVVEQDYVTTPNATTTPNTTTTTSLETNAPQSNTYQPTYSENTQEGSLKHLSAMLNSETAIQQKVQQPATDYEAGYDSYNWTMFNWVSPIDKNLEQNYNRSANYLETE